MAEERFTYNTCMGGGCHEFCCLKTITRDGKIVRTEKAILTGPESDRFECCQKGMEYARFADHPDRLCYPMKRTGERGEGKFERISWDQALSEIGTKVNELRERYGSRSILFTINTAGYPAGSSSLLPPILMRFIHSFDASASCMTSVDQSFFGAQAIDLGDVFAYGMSDPRLIAKSKHIIIWASNPVGNTRAAVTTRAILDAREAGATITTIGLFYNSTAAKSDRFVPIRRGTDTALALSMAREIIKRGACDFDYLGKCTVAPFLVRTDTGAFLRGCDVSAEGDPANYVMVSNGVPTEVSPHAHWDVEGIQFEGAIEIEGIVCKPAFQMLIDHLEEWTFERQEELTDVPAEVASALVDEYLAATPANIYLEEGLRYQNALQSYRAIELLAYLTGNIGKEGGGVTLIGMGNGHPTGLNEAPVAFPEGLENAKGNYVYPEDLYEEMSKDDPCYKAYFNLMGNPVHSNPGRNGIWKDFFDKMELVVVHDVFMSDTGKFADYLLPDTCTLERYELLPQGNHIILNEPAVERGEEVRTGSEFISALAQQVGLGNLFDKSDVEWMQVRLQTQDPAFTNVEPPITWERLKDEKLIRLAVPDTLYDPLATEDFMTASGRIEFYSEDYASVGMPMATWSPCLIDQLSAEDSARYPMHLFVGRPRLFMQTQPFNVIEDLIELHGKEPWMWLNAADAQLRGIQDGDMVEVYNDRGKAVLVAHLSSGCPKGVAYMWLNYRYDDYEEGGPTELMSTCGIYDTMDAFGKHWRLTQQRNRGLAPGEMPSFQAMMEGRMPTTMNWNVSFAGNYDIIWDNYCNVCKAEAR